MHFVFIDAKIVIWRLLNCVISQKGKHENNELQQVIIVR